METTNSAGHTSAGKPEQPPTPQWFRTTSYLLLTLLLSGVVAIGLAMIWRLIRWILV